VGDIIREIILESMRWVGRLLAGVTLCTCLGLVLFGGLLREKFGYSDSIESE
jgi:hypothetical protein